MYSSDPLSDPEAVRFDEISYADYVNRGLQVMDISSVNLCRENKIPIMVFDFSVKGSLMGLIAGKTAHTLIR